MKTFKSMTKVTGMLVAVGVAFLALPVSQAFANATIVIANNDGAGEGFNDPAVRAPVGGNSGTTLGAQRLIAFQEAARIWGLTLDSAVTIRVRSAFDPLTCTAGSATLGSAGPTNVFRDFPGAPVQNVWYYNALTDKLSLADQGGPTDGADINARFNTNLGSPGCLTGSPFYYGLDGNHGTAVDLVAVLLHEFAHGLGFSTQTSSTSGNALAGYNTIFDAFIHDNSTNKGWIEMIPSERITSAINARNVVWTGSTVTSELPGVLSLGTPLLRLSAPAPIAGVYAVGTASFGPALNSPGVTGTVVAAIDPVETGGTASDGCSPFANAGAVAGNIALVSRGLCGFTVKVKNAQNAGAIAVLVADNVAGSPPPGLGGADPTITIPAVRVSLADGNLIRAQTAPVTANLSLDMTVYSGADPAGRAMLNTPNPVVPGSSVSHYEPLAFRNLLMEPAINGDLTHSVASPQDLTLAQLRDIGWFADADVDGIGNGSDACPATASYGTPVIIDGCNTLVNDSVASNGCSVVETLAPCSASATHAKYTSCVSSASNQLRLLGAITLKQQSAIQRCAMSANIP